MTTLTLRLPSEAKCLLSKFARANFYGDCRSTAEIKRAYEKVLAEARKTREREARMRAQNEEAHKRFLATCRHGFEAELESLPTGRVSKEYVIRPHTQGKDWVRRDRFKSKRNCGRKPRKHR